ncbi:MAG: ketopantoate reductase family protein, partial [Tepidiformaceae bacterium]
VVGHPRELDFRDDDVVILTMKTQDTEAALRDLELSAGTAIPVICAQNGVENERLAARRFANVYAMLVALPATFLTPGEVIASGAPLSGALHCGCYPGGVDATIVAVAADLRESHYRCDSVGDAMRFKYRKLMFNLGNGLEVITSGTAWGATGALGDFTARLRDEAAACYAAAGIEAMPADEYTERVSSHYRAQPIDGQPRSGSSTRQSVLRGHTTVEVDYLNGEIELLGKLWGVPTPHNTVVRREAVAAAARGAGEGRPIEELLALVERERATAATR